MRHRLFLPTSLRNGRPAPLLVALHGCFQSASDFATGTRFDEIGEEYGAIVAYPEQQKRANASGCWNWFESKHQTRHAGEPAKILRLVEHLARSYPVDRERIYVVGISAGASMAAILGEQAPDVFSGVGIMAGVALHASNNFLDALAAMAGKRPEEDPRDPPRRRNGASHPSPAAYARMRVAVWTGTNDPTVAPSNSTTLAQQFVRLLGLDETQATSEASEDRRVELRVWRDASGRERVALITVAGMYHAWSGGSAQGSYTYPPGPDASTAMFEFFSGA